LVFLPALACALLGSLAGCSGRGSFLSGGPTASQLKTSLSHLEYENAQLSRNVAKLQRENRAMEDRLAREEIDNGELTARLDDARNLLRDRGVDPDDRVRSRPDELRDSSGEGSGARTLPAAQPARRRRKPPVARIPGQVEVPLDLDNGPTLGPHAVPDSAPEAEQSSWRLDSDLDHHTFSNGPLRWMPVASGTGDPASRVR
jgi:hypothetical protein